MVSLFDKDEASLVEVKNLVLTKQKTLPYHEPAEIKVTQNDE